VNWEKWQSSDKKMINSLIHSRVTCEVYRSFVRSADLTTCRVAVKETDMAVSAHRNLLEEARSLVVKYRRHIEDYIHRHPSFVTSFVPLRRDPVAPQIVNTMIEASSRCGVGPMAAVAGAVADYVGMGLLPLSRDLIVENGGDVFVSSSVRREVLVLAENSELEEVKIALGPTERPMGVCTSSGKLGHSASLGKADAVMVVGESASLADAAATGIANLVREPGNINMGIERAREIGVTGVVIVCAGHMGAWGRIEFVS